MGNGSSALSCVAPRAESIKRRSTIFTTGRSGRKERTHRAGDRRHERKTSGASARLCLDLEPLLNDEVVRDGSCRVVEWHDALGAGVPRVVRALLRGDDPEWHLLG